MISQVESFPYLYKQGLAIKMFVMVFSKEMCSCVCVIPSLNVVFKINENEEDEDAVSFYMKGFNGSME